jgi:flagellar protein FlaF
MTLSRYQATLTRTQSPRDIEIRAFAHVNTLLANAAPGPARIAALHTNHKLWSILLADIASPGNALPRELKGRLASLAIWAQRESMRLMNADAPLDALMSVNRDMADGLAAQSRASGQVNGQVGAQPGAGGDADKARVGQRIAAGVLQQSTTKG